ncbi:MAG: uncharacterized protein A8A55_0358 [Amphiamblys sp. WSBS2006]|nr:MAG: uncharacterized protein A8A55_0358 [Amphiamblys sp. WSBS2006]
MFFCAEKGSRLTSVVGVYLFFLLWSLFQARKNTSGTGVQWSEEVRKTHVRFKFFMALNLLQAVLIGAVSYSLEKVSRDLFCVQGKRGVLGDTSVWFYFLPIALGYKVLKKAAGARTVLGGTEKTWRSFSSFRMCF